MAQPGGLPRDLPRPAPVRSEPRAARHRGRRATCSWQAVAASGRDVVGSQPPHGAGGVMRSSGYGAIILLGALGLASAAALAVMSPITQDQSYHAFADGRTLLGIPNFWNVASNLPFVAVGAAGLALYRRDAPATALFVGILLTGFGSAYYHLAPSDSTLFWDRLPMTIA